MQKQGKRKCSVAVSGLEITAEFFVLTAFFHKGKLFIGSYYLCFLRPGINTKREQSKRTRLGGALSFLPVRAIISTAAYCL